MHTISDTAAPVVLVLGMPEDTVAASVAERLREVFEVASVAVEDAGDLREVAERYRERLGVLVVGAADSRAVSTLVTDLDRGMKWLSERMLVVVDELAKLDLVPAPLLEAMPYLAADAGELEDLAALVEGMMRLPREVDVLSSLVRSAVARRSVDSLPPLLGDWSAVDRLDPAHLELAHRGDEGLRANALWAHWTMEREAAALEILGDRLVAHAHALLAEGARPAGGGLGGEFEKKPRR